MRRSDSARTASNPLARRSAFRLKPRTERAGGEDGLTALEVLVVMIVTGILVAVAIASYLEFHGDRLA